MSINELQLEARKLQIQLNAMAPTGPLYYQLLAQYQQITTALGVARVGVREGLSF
jgi:hypothetical protein